MSQQACTTTTTHFTITERVPVRQESHQLVEKTVYLQPQQQLVGTKIESGKKAIAGTHLHEDTWYRITLQGGGLFTWMYAKVGATFNHTMIVFKGPAKEYQLGEKYYHDGHWKIVQSEVPGYVTFVNRSQPNAVLTYAENASSGKYVVLYFDGSHDADYLPGGKHRNDCLWKIVPEEGSIGTYNIISKGFGGIVNYSYTNVAEGKRHVIVYDTTSPKYEHDEEYLWHFNEITN